MGGEVGQAGGGARVSRGRACERTEKFIEVRDVHPKIPDASRRAVVPLGTWPALPGLGGLAV